MVLSGGTLCTCYYCMMNGISAKSFAPESKFSRAQMAQAKYTDISQDASYAAAIIRAMWSGVLTGYGDGYVDPDDPITREQLAVILYRYTGQKGSNTSGIVNGTDPVTRATRSQAATTLVLFHNL